jgi:acyl-CoA reductase-like NAD-dependent aldehyde dehydrogenase
METMESGATTVDVINPFSGAVDRTYSFCTKNQLCEQLTVLRTAQKGWQDVPLKERIKRVSDGLNYFETHAEIIAKDICLQMGRPMHQARGEINGLLERGRYMCHIAEQALAAEVFDDQVGFNRSIHHAPYGVVYVISAWNYPLLITINSLVPALIAGNTVVLKHATQTTELGQHFSRAFADIFEHPVMKALVIPHSLSEKIIREGLVNHVVFTGSVEAGQKILKQCADSVIAPNLELGGKDGVYLDQSADLRPATETIIDGACFNSGQSCCGIERAYVHKSVYPEFLDHALELMHAYRLGDPLLPETTLGPLADAKNAKIMVDHVQQAVTAGARCLTGGAIEKIGGGTFFQPTLLADVPKDAQALKFENFGPILAVVPVNDMSEAITEINDSDLGLTSAIFSKDVRQADQFFHEVEAGTVFLNRCDYLDPALPWTGFKKSGCGSALSRYGFYSVTQRKSKHFRLP